ncbi:MAG TPA: nucleoside kinase [Candidatus Tidjanibacter faecipullorum]|uniref:Nucleoside kinase n=1 Tax=Candidatus Tidjanibacter faecipullorum TaxID=2838766 RepID=A0A9D2IKG1_9BACT|nr:nucleoside kinase [Candidatus Tidjanibacter faecipullorum]
MNDILIDIVCENSDATLTVEWGTTLRDVVNMLPKPERPYLAAYVNNSIKELDYRVYRPVSVRFIDVTHFEGTRVYQRTLFFTLQKAVHDLFPDKRFSIPHSVSKGFYCEIEGMDRIAPDDIDRLKARMDELIRQDIPIVRRKVRTEEAREAYARLGYDDKITLLDSCPRLYVTLYALADIVGYFYGALAPSTGYLHLYDLKPYYKGLFIAVPKRTNPDELEGMIRQEKMFDLFTEYQEWTRVLGVPNIGTLNRRILDGEASDLIKVAEAFHEKRLGSIADAIYAANRQRNMRLVLISGPSSSGKTTFAKRLGIQMRIVGLNPVLISLDDYFLEREQTPRDANGDYDYETIDALDLKTFNEHLERLFAGESVEIPRYDFISGRRQWHEEPLRLDDRSVLVVEGIHGLNPRLTEKIPDEYKFRIYVSVFTTVMMDDMNRIPTTDNRLIRRIVRDNATRGSDAVSTLRRWGSVRTGEEKYIFPYQENADVMFNSSLLYELPVLRRYVEPLLYKVPDTVPEFGEAHRLLKFLNNFQTISPEEIPPTSLLREFIGGSSFRY